MATNDCNKTKPCGCEDQPYASLPPCNPIDCPDPIVCSEINNAQCIIYTGPDIVCGDDVVVQTNTNLSQAFVNLVNYVCTGESTVTQEIICGQDIVVPADTSVVEASELITAYFCNRFISLNDQLVTLNDLECGKPTFTIPANTPLNRALELVFNYFCGFLDIVFQQLSELQIQINSLPVKFSSGPLTGNNLIAHNFVSTDLILSVAEANIPPSNVFIHGVDYVYTIVNSNEIQLNEVVPGGLGTYKVTIIS